MIITTIALILLLAIASYIVYHHQCLLRDRAQMMRDAIRFHDFNFRLSTKGLLFGERALQEALNDMGNNIQELEAHNEVESWQRLTRVLTHEIMNATAPIQSITQAYLNSPEIKQSPYEEGIRAIFETSSGLSLFVDSYRKLTQLQEPVPTNINLHEFVQNISSLYPMVEWNIDISPDVELNIDENLFRQVLINLIKNAIEAEAKKISIKWDKRILISNNGHIIPEDAQREIFIPFFTTKNNGSGIGLSLSRQILIKQGFMLSLEEKTQEGYNVTFAIEKDLSPRHPL